MIRSSVFAGRYIQGPGALDKLPVALTQLGKKAACLIDSAVADELGPRIREWNGIDLQVQVASGGCTPTTIATLTELANGCDMIIAMGGGRVIDTGRAAADDLRLPFVCVPTAAASDAPCSALAVIYDDNGQVLHDRFVKHNPAIVVVDTSILIKAPIRLFISGMGDALATWYEADSCARSGATNLCGGRPTRLALEAARLCRDTLLTRGRKALEDCRQQRLTEAFEDAVEANVLLSGLGFESGGVAAAHAIHHGLAEVHSCHSALHGEKVTIGLLTSLFLSARSDEERRELFVFCRDVGLPTRLAHVGLDPNDRAAVERVARRACRQGEIIHNEPYPVEWTQVVEAMEAMDFYGSTFQTEQ